MREYVKIRKRFNVMWLGPLVCERK